MRASERMKIYEWVRDHKDKHGVQYPRLVTIEYVDYEIMRRTLHNLGAGYESIQNPKLKRGTKQLRIFIK